MAFDGTLRGTGVIAMFSGDTVPSITYGAGMKQKVFEKISLSSGSAIAWPSS